MASKEYEVITTVKVKGVENGPGEIVKLEPHQADRLLGVFVKEYVAPVEKKPAGGKGSKDGL